MKALFLLLILDDVFAARAYAVQKWFIMNIYVSYIYLYLYEYICKFNAENKYKKEIYETLKCE